jgi:hypothetical protein
MRGLEYNAEKNLHFIFQLNNLFYKSLPVYFDMVKFPNSNQFIFQVNSMNFVMI